MRTGMTGGCVTFLTICFCIPTRKSCHILLSNMCSGILKIRLWQQHFRYKSQNLMSKLLFYSAILVMIHFTTTFKLLKKYAGYQH